MVTREKFDAVCTLWHYFNFTVPMISQHLQMWPWEVEAIIEHLEKRPQLELFQITKREQAA